MSLRLDLRRALNVKIPGNLGPYVQHTKYSYKIGQSDIFSKPDLKKKKKVRVGQNWVGRVGKTTNIFFAFCIPAHVILISSLPDRQGTRVFTTPPGEYNLKFYSVESSGPCTELASSPNVSLTVTLEPGESYNVLMAGRRGELKALPVQSPSHHSHQTHEFSSLVIGQSWSVSRSSEGTTKTIGLLYGGGAGVFAWPFLLFHKGDGFFTSG